MASTKSASGVRDPATRTTASQAARGGDQQRLDPRDHRGAAGGLAAAFGIWQTGAVPRLQDSRRWLVDHWDQAGYFLAEWVLVLGAMHGSMLLIAAWATVQGRRRPPGLAGSARSAHLAASSVYEFVLPELGRRPQLSARDRLRLSCLISGPLVLVGLAWGLVLLMVPDGIGSQLLGDTWPMTRTVLPAATLWFCAILQSMGPAVILRALGRAASSLRINAHSAVLLVVSAFSELTSTVRLGRRPGSPPPTG